MGKRYKNLLIKTFNVTICNITMQARLDSVYSKFVKTVTPRTKLNILLGTFRAKYIGKIFKTSCQRTALRHFENHYAIVLKYCKFKH